MGALDPEKILMILVVALIVLGPERLPKVARQLGGAWRQLVSYREKVEAEVRAAIPDLDLPRIPRNPTAAVTGFITGLGNEAKATINGSKRLSDASSVGTVEEGGELLAPSVAAPVQPDVPDVIPDVPDVPDVRRRRRPLRPPLRASRSASTTRA